jgi:hypothetical protein
MRDEKNEDDEYQQGILCQCNNQLEISTRTMRCNEIIKTADYEKTNNYIMKMMMRDDYSEEE